MLYQFIKLNSDPSLPFIKTPGTNQVPTEHKVSLSKGRRHGIT